MQINKPQKYNTKSLLPWDYSLCMCAGCEVRAGLKHEIHACALSTHSGDRQLVENSGLKMMLKAASSWYCGHRQAIQKVPFLTMYLSCILIGSHTCFLLYWQWEFSQPWFIVS